MEDMVTAIPPRVRGNVAYALGVLRRWEEALASARAMDVAAHQPGRYEHELRHGVAWASKRAYVARAEGMLAVFEALAKDNGLDPAEAIEAFGGRPVASEEVEAVREWAPTRR